MEEIPDLIPADTITNYVNNDRSISSTATTHEFLPNAKIKVPVTILTGFLGAGKSTLLGRILKERHGSKVAVVMNELGPSSGVDKAVIKDKTGNVGEEWLEVENGCLCCTAKNETFLALESLLMRRPDIEHIVIETSGAADPTTLIQKLWVDEALESRVLLNAVVCMVDVSRGESLISNGNASYCVEAARQIAVSDYIILNKMDKLQSSSTLDKVKEMISLINPIADMIPTKFSDVPLSVLFGQSHYYLEDHHAKRDLNDSLSRALNISANPHSSLNMIRSFTVYLTKPVIIDIFEKWLFSLLWERRLDDLQLSLDDQLIRVKGIVTAFSRVTGQVSIYSLQAVEESYEMEDLKEGADPEQLTTIIFIGRFSENIEDHIKSSILKLQRKN